MIVHADPSVAINNHGDRIISIYVRREFENAFPSHEIVSCPTQLFTISRRFDRLLEEATTIVVGGSNLLTHRFPRIHQWANLHQYLRHSEKIVLFGVGWHSYETSVWPLNRNLISRLANGRLHSVRDTYTKEKLREFGVNSAMTSCPTLWGLSGLFSSVSQPSRIVVTLTYYRTDIFRDSRFFGKILACCNDLGVEAIFWPQSVEDGDYFNHLEIDHRRFRVLPSSLAAFENSIESDTLYIGTRLHAGIHAMNLGGSARIFAIDNRATEISRDVGIPTFSRVGDLYASLEETFQINLPKDEIEAFSSRLALGT